MPSKERADFRRSRHTWSEVLLDAGSAMGCSHTLQLLVTPLSEMAAPRPFDWRTAELALHCVRCAVLVKLRLGTVGPADFILCLPFTANLHEHRLWACKCCPMPLCK